jgi:pantoate kinase
MTNNFKSIIIEVPHRISGFFEIVDQIGGIKIQSPEKIGSRGAGFNLSAIGRTKIIVEEKEPNKVNKCDIFINGKKYNEKAETTFFIFNYIRKYISNPLKIIVSHNFDLPVGCGYGASGAGALGTIIGLDSLLKLRLTKKEMGRIAHISEVINKTGLGTVCGQLCGGLCILKEPGYPCNCERINLPKGLRVICGSFGMIHTKTILGSETLNTRIKEAGRKALNKILTNKDVHTFMQASIEFVKDTDILTLLNLTKINEIMNNLNKLDIIGASMNQLGRSVFAICKIKDAEKVIEILETYKPEIKIFNLAFNENNPIIFKYQ